MLPLPGGGDRRPSWRLPRIPVKALLTAVAGADLAVVAGWTTFLWLRVVLIVLITVVGVVAQLRFGGRRPSAAAPPGPPRWLPQEAELPFFHGRRDDLGKLQRRHEYARRAMLPDAAQDGPVILPIHGRPGVGKTALAQRLALRLAGEYPDGQLYVSMGDEGQDRAPRETLLTLLGQLKWPEAEMLGRSKVDAAALARIFRGKTAGKRMLILLDGVPSRGQLSQVLPGTNTCTVITTSRANLHVGSERSHRLEPLTPDEATAILRVTCGSGGMAEVDLVAEAIELCDCLPEAVLAAGERARDEGQGGLVQTVALLRDRERHLAALTYGGRNMADRMASEYGKLNDLERRAFLLLTVPASETFVPWVLQPLMDSREVGSVQAGNLMAKISRGGLLELEGRDPSGFGRYRFSLLARRFGEQRIREGDITPGELVRAGERFARAYFAGSLRVLARAGIRDVPAAPFHVPDFWYPEVPGWEATVARNIDFWSRAEFGNLIRAIMNAARYGQQDACWLLALQAGDCFSPSADHGDVQRAFAEALTSAARRPEAAAEIRVRMAWSGYLAAVHDYAQAIGELTTILDLAQTAGDKSTQAEALRRLGHAWQEMGDYSRASRYLRDGELAARQSRRRESRLIALLLAENEALTSPDHWIDQLPVSGPPDRRDSAQFIEKMVLSRAACRRRDRAVCDHLLSQARQMSDGNLAHRLDVEHEEAAAMLHDAPPQVANSQAAVLLRKAVSTLRWADRLDRPYPQARARCLLAQALIRAGQPDEGLCQLTQAEHFLQALPDDEARGLSVAVERTRGAAWLALRRYPEAVMALEHADLRLDQRASWARGEILVLLGTARRESGQPVDALAAHAAAVDIFRQHRDQAALAGAFDELCFTLGAVGVRRFQMRRMRRRFAREPWAALS